MEVITYAEFATQLDGAVEWLSSIGITDENRIRLHRDNIRLLADAQTRDQIDELRGRLGHERLREIFSSWVEAFEFLEVFNFLQNLEHRELLPVLKNAVEGPADAFRESPIDSSSAGRNFMFELVVAAKLARAGLQPRLGEPDVAADFGEYRFLIQCKRPFRAAGMHANVISAGAQLRRDLQLIDQRITGVGIVAVSVSKIVNQGDSILEVDERTNLPQALSAAIDLIWEKNKESFLNLTGPNIGGALIHLATPTVITGENSFLAAGMTSIYAFRGTRDIREVLGELERLMRGDRQ